MKILGLVQTLFLFLIISCGDDNSSSNGPELSGPVTELTEESAAAIIRDCHRKQARTGPIGWVNLGRTAFNTSKADQVELLERYKKLDADGYVDMTDEKKLRNGVSFMITATDKSKPYVYKDEADEEGAWKTTNRFMYGYNLEFIDVQQIHEVPMFNGAEVMTTMQGIATPFYDFIKESIKKKNPLEPHSVKVNMKNTSDGWLYCDKEGNR